MKRSINFIILMLTLQPTQPASQPVSQPGASEERVQGKYLLAAS